MVGFSHTMADRLLDYAFGGIEPPSIPGVAISLHTADPGNNGANEVAGMGYSRQPSSFGPASGGVITVATNIQFVGLPASWILYIGAWTTDVSPVFSGSMPNGQLKQFAATASDNLFTSASHGFVNGMPVALLGLTGVAFPAGLALDTPYYVRNATTNTFQLSATDGSSDPILDVTVNGSGTARRVQRMFPDETFTILAGSQFSFLGM